MCGDDRILRCHSNQFIKGLRTLIHPVLFIYHIIMYALTMGILLSTQKGSQVMNSKTDASETVRRSMLKGDPTWLSLGRGSRAAVVTRSNARAGWALPYSMKTLRQKQLADADLAPLIQWKESGSRPIQSEVCKASPETRHLYTNWDNLEIKEGVLFRKYLKKDVSGGYIQMIVPRSLWTEILKQMHNSILSGHLGRKKTQEKLLQRFYWFNVRPDVANWIRQCNECGAIKTPQQHPRAPMGTMTVGAPLDRLSTDILGPLPETPRKNRYILVVTDHFTKWVEILAVPDQTAATCADRILNEVISRYGCPYDLLSDQGRNYESAIFSELCKLLEIRKTRTTPGNPRCNGQTERFNKTLVRMIKAYLKGEQREWDRHLGCLAAAYRATPHESTGCTPNLLMLGREVRLPAEVMFGSHTITGESVATYGDYVDKLKETMHHAHEIARKY